MSVTRLLILILLAPVLAGKATGNEPPKEILDERTGATIVTVARSLVFIGQGDLTFDASRCYASVSAASVDQSGKVSTIFVAYFWCAGAKSGPDKADSRSAPLMLQADTQRIELTRERDASTEQAVTNFPYRPPLGHAEPQVYPADLATMKAVGNCSHLALYIGSGDKQHKYELFEDGRRALRDFVTQVAQ